jgi:hypothetical protein
MTIVPYCSQLATDGTKAKFRFKFTRLEEPFPILGISFLAIAGNGAMGKAEQYRHYAAECIRLAQQSQYPPEKDMLLSMASAWRRLAEHAEKNRQEPAGESQS